MFSAASEAPHDDMIGPSDWWENAPVFASCAAQLSANRSGQLADLSADRPRDVRSALTRDRSCASYVLLPDELDRVVVEVLGRGFVVRVTRVVGRLVVLRLADVVREELSRLDAAVRTVLADFVTALGDDVVGVVATLVGDADVGTPDGASATGDSRIASAA